MILSSKHRFIFARGRKVGGTSVEMALSTICGEEDVVPAMIAVDERMRQEAGGRCGNYSDTPSLERAYVELVVASPLDQLHLLHPPKGRYSAHMTVADIRAAFGEPIDDFRLLIVQRCPYQRVLSALNMALSFESYRGGGPMQGELERFAVMFDRALANGQIDGLRNLALYRAWDGAATEVLRHERLQEGLDAFLAELGLGPIQLPRAKLGRMSDGLDPAVVLRADQIAAINRIFADEFEAYGYTRI